MSRNILITACIILFLAVGGLSAKYLLSLPSSAFQFSKAKPTPAPKVSHAEPKVITWSHVTFDKYWDLEFPSHFEVNAENEKRGYVISGGAYHNVNYKITMYFPVLTANKNHPAFTTLQGMVDFSFSTMDKKLRDQIVFENIKVASTDAVLATHIPRPNDKKEYTGDYYNRAYIWTTPKLNARIIEVVGETGRMNPTDLDAIFKHVVLSVK